MPKSMTTWRGRSAKTWEYRNRDTAQPGAGSDRPPAAFGRTAFHVECFPLLDASEIMAIPWLAAAFKAIPWKEVVIAAPSIVEGTKKLWSSVTRTEKQPGPAKEQANEASSTRSDQLYAIDARLLALEAKTTDVAREAVTSAELIKSLAEQSAQLVQAVEILRLRTRRLVWFTVVLGLSTGVLLLWVILLLPHH